MNCSLWLYVLCCQLSILFILRPAHHLPRLPKLCFNIMKDRELKRRLKEYHLTPSGGRQVNFISFMNFLFVVLYDKFGRCFQTVELCSANNKYWYGNWYQYSYLYASVDGAPDAYGSTCVYMCLCVILLFIFLHNCWKLDTFNHIAGLVLYSLESLLIRFSI